MSNARRDPWSAALIAIAAAGFTFLAVVSFLTLSDANTTLGDVAQAQTNHAQTLSQLKAIALSNHANGVKLDGLVEQVQSYEKSLGGATQTLDQILQEAGATSTQIKADDQAICAATGAQCTG